MHIGRLHYSLIYLPEYHGSLLNSLKTIWHLDAWLSYIKTPVGLFFNLIGLLLCIIIPSFTLGITFLDDKLNERRKAKQ